MEQLLSITLYFIILIPLAISVLTIPGKIFSRVLNKNIIYFLSLMASFSGIIYSLYGLINLKDSIIEKSFNLISINNYNLTYGIYIDKISLLFGLTLFIVSFAVQLFSVSYLKKEEQNLRFFAFLNIFNFSMLGLIFAQNLYQLYIFWELVGIVSYLLINFDYMNEKISRLSKKILIINRLGDCAFLAGILILSNILISNGFYKFVNLGINDLETFSKIINTNLSPEIYMSAAGLFIIAALVKSAQIPFYNWLQDAMNAKIPVSALLHSATMVAMGIFLIIRIFPIFSNYELLLNIISVFGITTALVCSLCAFTQENPKKLLAYSTSAQLGLMFLALGNLNIAGAIIFFITHAISKSLMFLTLTSKEDENNNLWKYTALLFGGLSTMGILFAGHPSKEILLSGLNSNYQTLYTIVIIITVFYITKLFISQYKLTNFKTTISFEFLSFLILIFSNIGFYIYIRNNYNYETSYILYISLIAIPIAVFAILKTKPAGFIHNTLLNGFYLDKIYSVFLNKLYFGIAKICKVFDDEVFSNYKPILLCSKNMVCIVNLIETKLMNGYVSTIEYLSNFASKKHSNIQTSDIRNYNAYALIIITVCLILLIMIYTGILILIGEK